MSRVITFSRFFPAYHPRKGEETFFVEKIWSSLKEDFSKTLIGLDNELINFSEGIYKLEPKYHTIRAGNRWEVGDKFSPRVWSGKPYASKQIVISPDIEIKKIWNFEIEQWGTVTINGNVIYNYRYLSDNQMQGTDTYYQLCKNDGLHADDFDRWFKSYFPSWHQFSGQVICWNENINY